jgi:glycosyltransferase involved in cell wall biosynthesis
MHRRKRKVIGWGLGAPYIGGPLANIRSWERLNFIRSLDAVVAYSRLGAEQYRQLGFRADKIYTATNATAHAPSAPPPKRPDRFENQATVLFVGRLQTRKRLDLLFQTCALLPESLKPKLLIIGDGPARNEFEKLASQIYPQTEFLGAIHGNEIDPFFNKADLFVLPGTGGLAIQQAMAHALPIIVARGDGTQDDLVRAENGWQVAPDDLPALTEALLEALSNPARLRQMGIASYRIVSEEINIEKMVEIFCKAIEDISSQ